MVCFLAQDIPLRYVKALVMDHCPVVLTAFGAAQRKTTTKFLMPTPGFEQGLMPTFGF